MFFDVKFYYEVTALKSYDGGLKSHKHRPMELKVSSIMQSPMVSEKDAGITRERKLVSLTIMSRKTRYQHAKEWNWALPHPVCKSYKTLRKKARLYVCATPQPRSRWR